MPHLFYGPPWVDVDIIHLFNDVYIGPERWVVTFETAVPRWTPERKNLGGVTYETGYPAHSLLGRTLINRLAAPGCVRLIAMSECSRAIEQDYLASAGPAATPILDKLTVLHPPQPTLTSSIEDRHSPRDALVFTLVGRDFFRKGGLETLRAFRTFSREGGQFRLNIVSDLTAGDYASKASALQRDEASRILDENRDMMVWHGELPNEQVLDIMRHTDVGLLPTYADTYGYSVLEFQAAGCPVITTDVRALPEINSAEVGWIVAVEKDHLGRTDKILGTTEGRSHFSQTLERGLLQALETIDNDPETVRSKGAAALARIRREHDPGAHLDALRRIYQEGTDGP